MIFKVGYPISTQHSLTTKRYHCPLSSVSVCVCLSVCLPVREHISGTTIFTKLSACYLWPWLGSPLVALRYVMYFRLMDDVTFAQNGSGDAERAYIQTDSTEGSTKHGPKYDI